MFYAISGQASNRYKYVVLDHGYYEIERLECSDCGRTYQKCQMVYWPPEMRLEGGKRYPDFLSVSVPFEDKCGIIVSSKVLDAFLNERITGFQAIPIDIEVDHIIEYEKVPQYFYLLVSGRISLDYTAMRYRKKNHCTVCGSYVWSRQNVGESALDHGSWDGADLCCLTDFPNFVICTQRVINLVRAYKFKGACMRSSSELFMPLKAVKIC